MDAREKLVEIVCDAMEADGCIGHCNYPPCFAVERVVNALISNGVTVQEWISVKDRLPEEFTNVLVCDVREGYVSKWEYRSNGIWDNDGFSFYNNDITHWTPLPQLPKGE